jgi:hypothetical protein
MGELLQTELHPSSAVLSCRTNLWWQGWSEGQKTHSIIMQAQSMSMQKNNVNKQTVSAAYMLRHASLAWLLNKIALAELQETVQETMDVDAAREIRRIYSSLQAGRQAGSVCCSMHKYISLKTVPIAALAPQQSAHWQAAANITQHMQAQLWNLL